jgi:type I restriction enzyme M protein
VGKKSSGSYHDIKGFVGSASLVDIEKHNFVLTPGRYVAFLMRWDDDVILEDRMSANT